jgi:hypothetical protein
MYLFYVDESGNLDPRQNIAGKGGITIPGDPVYILTAVCLFEPMARLREDAQSAQNDADGPDL